MNNKKTGKLGQYTDCCILLPCWQMILVDFHLTIYIRHKQIDRKALHLCLIESVCVTERLFHINSDHRRKRQTGLKLMIEKRQLFTDGFQRYSREVKQSQVTLTKIPQNDYNQIKHCFVYFYLFKTYIWSIQEWKRSDFVGMRENNVSFGIILITSHKFPTTSRQKKYLHI